MRRIIILFILLAFNITGKSQTLDPVFKSVTTDELKERLTNGGVKVKGNVFPGTVGGANGMDLGRLGLPWDSVFVNNLIVAAGGSINNVPFVTPEMYGAVGNGTANDGPAIQAAINSKRPVFMSGRKYNTNSTIDLSDSTTIFGSGHRTVISTTLNIPIFSIKGANCNIQDITFEGDDGDTNQVGISVRGNSTLSLPYIQNKVTNCQFINLGCGIYIDSVLGTTSSFHQGSMYIVNSTVSSCTNGFYLGVRAEYVLLTGCQAYQCGKGLIIKSGNSSWIGGQITDNTVGFHLSQGLNDGHASMVGTKLNHNTHNVIVDNIGQNWTFTSCQFYSGAIAINTSSTIKFGICEFGGIYSIAINGSRTVFTSCTFNDALTPANFTVTGIHIPLNVMNSFRTTNTSPFFQRDTARDFSVGGSAFFSNTPASVNQTDSFLTKDATTGQLKAVPRLAATSVLDFPSTNAASSSDLTITLTGAILGDVVSLGVSNASVVSNSCYTAWVSSANTVTVRFNNYSAGALDPNSGTFKVLIGR